MEKPANKTQDALLWFVEYLVCGIFRIELKLSLRQRKILLSQN